MDIRNDACDNIVENGSHSTKLTSGQQYEACVTQKARTARRRGRPKGSTTRPTDFYASVWPYDLTKFGLPGSRTLTASATEVVDRTRGGEP